MKGNVIQLNTLHLNSVQLNGIGKVQSVSLKGGSTEDPVFPPVEPPVEPEPTPTYTLSASVTNGKVSATKNGSAVNLPFTANEGDTIVLEVTPNDGYTFEGWADGNTDNPRSITMTADVVLSAQCVEVVQPPVGNYIQFEDKAVEAICVANWSSDGIGLTMEDAAAVTDIGATFRGNTEITSFDEFEYFTGVTFLGISTNQTSGGAFNGCTSLQSIKLPSSVTHLRPGAFNNCTSLRSVGDLSNVKQIDLYAFAGTPLEGEINLASAEGEIGYRSFAKTNITKILSLGNATIIGGSTRSDTGAFAECGLLQSVELPSTLTEIQNWAFYKCVSLEIVICRATTPPSLANTNAFSNTNNCPIYVPDASVEAYRTATNWNTYADRIHPLSEIEGVVIEDGYKLNNDGSLSQSSSMAVVGYVAINGGEYIRWGNSIGSLGLLCEYDETYKKLDYWNGEGSGRTIHTKTSSRFVKACFPSSDLDNAYIYDETNGEYLWKGANVE